MFVKYVSKSVHLLWLQIQDGQKIGWQTPFLGYPHGIELNDGEVVCAVYLSHDADYISRQSMY